MRRIILSLALTMAATAAAADGRTQLERMAGIPEAEAGLYSVHQLALIKKVMENELYSSNTKAAKIAKIKAGTVGATYD